jgi:hypothetical protein
MEYPRSFTYSYKLTVTIRDRGLVSEASSVVRVQEVVNKQRNMVPPILCGSATVIPLRNGKAVFALLNGPYHDPVPGRRFWRGSPTRVLLEGLKLPVEWAWQDDSGIRKLARSRQPLILSATQMPELVTFRDNKNPNSIVRVDPDHPDRVLGDGVRIERVKIEVTDAAVTKGSVARVLPWFDPRRNYLDGTKPFLSGNNYHSRQFERCDRKT